MLSMKLRLLFKNSEFCLLLNIKKYLALLSHVIILLILIPNIVLANVEDDVLQLIRNAENKPLTSQAGCDLQNNLKIESNKNVNLKNKYLIFVSFSMPKESLKSLYLDSKEQATLVMRGLKDDSFKKTAIELQSLQIVVDIDPTLFKKYQVTTVPTIVAVHDSCHHSIQGNISFAYAKSKLELL